MNQSDRLRYVKEYQSNPLRRDYERNKDLVIKKPFLVHLINLGNVFFFVMVIVYGRMFISADLLDSVLIIVFGLANIFLGLVYYVYSTQWKKNIIEKHNSVAIEKLNKEYRKKVFIL